MTRSTYTAETVNGVLAIIDRGKGQSVTNDAERVLAECSERLGLGMPSIVIYRDGTGEWDGLAHEGGVFQGFYFLKTRDVNLAIAKAKARAKGRQK